MTAPPPTSDYQLFQRGGSLNWYVRFSIKGHGQVRKSLETEDNLEAEKKTYRVWFEAQHRAKLGLDIRERSFREVATQYIEHLRIQCKNGEKKEAAIKLDIGTINRYFIDFFKDRPIDAIGLRDMTKYLEWRKVYWTTGAGSKIDQIVYERAGRRIRRPVPTTREIASRSRLKRESVILRQIFNQAYKWGYITANHVPVIEVEKVDDNPRPSFSAKEFITFKNLAAGRIIDEGISRHVKNERKILFAYINLAAYSGMRPTELKNLNWGDVKNYRPADNGENRKVMDISIDVRAKKKSRNFIPQPHCVISFDFLRAVFMDWMKREPGKDDPLFINPTGKRLGSVAKSLTNLLKLAGLEKDHRGVKRTAYSFRHFYISQMLVNVKDVFLIAKNTGTSPDMIDRFYGHVDVHTQADILRGQWLRGT